MTSKTCTVLLGVTTLCAWGSLAEIVKALLRQQPIVNGIGVLMVLSTLAAGGVWWYFRSRGLRPEVKSFVGSVPQGAALLSVCVLAFVVPGFFSRGTDIIDLVVTAVIAGAVVWLVLHLLRRRYFTPPDSPSDL
ncbi:MULTISPECIES: hypothetical protein [Brevibacterium]|uniref:Uncharacterized protein n=1 Tax=Brevibacterium casei TaxID=33889 RepID=A0A7T4A1S9_9MICO|nr:MULTISPECIES: hypothetical protein [Brevibacterium]QQB15750.1 hypothetical protein I6H47_07495 [Brevibacterium casei]